MLKWSLEVSLRDEIRNEYTRGTPKITGLQDKIGEGRLKWYGHVQRRGEEYVGGRVERVAVGRRRQGRSKRRMHDCYQEDMREVLATQEDTQNRERWRRKIRTGHP